MLSRLQVVGPVADSRDPRIERLQRPPQGAGVDVVGCMTRCNAPQHRQFVAGPSHLRSEPADGTLPHVPVRVDQARDDEPAPGVDHLCLRRRCDQVVADLSDEAVTNEDVAVDEVTEARVDSDDVAALDEQFGGHDGSQPPVFEGYGK